jgi:ABC-type Fe3+-hydroxamate transport system substrate-binding protein
VGDGLRPDMERILALKPDLLVRWDYGGQPAMTGTPGALLAQLGVAVYTSSPRTLADIPEAVSSLGQLLGTSNVAEPEAQRLRQQLAALAKRYENRPAVRVFYQLGANPIYTINDHSIINDALRLCGAVNVFGTLPVTAPLVSRESVLAVRPQAIVISQTGAGGQAIAASWRALGPALPAASHISFIDPDAMNRPGPRMIEATRTLCEQIDKAR